MQKQNKNRMVEETALFASTTIKKRKKGQWTEVREEGLKEGKKGEGKADRKELRKETNKEERNYKRGKVWNNVS